MKHLRISSHVTVRDTDPLVREHRVHDIHILPGVSMLDAVYKTLEAAKCPAHTVVLREILFHEPVVTHATMDRKLTVTVTLQGDRGEVSVRSVPSRNGQVVSDDSTLHMNCTLWRTEAVGGSGGLQPLPQEDTLGPALDLAECYAVSQSIGIHHDDFMKCRGTVAPLANGRCRGTMALSERAGARMGDFLLHPVFLDGSTIVPLFNLRHRKDEATLFIPFAIEEFRTVGLAGHRQVQVLVEHNDVGTADQEILHYSSALFDMNGQPLARIRNFGVKRVRSLDGINRLLASGSSSRQHAAATVNVPAAETNASASNAPADGLLGLIGAMIAKGSGRPWQASHADKPFFDLGLDSLGLLDMAEALESKLGVRLYPTLLFECPTAEQLANYLRQTFPAEVERTLAAQPVVAAVPDATTRAGLSSAAAVRASSNVVSAAAASTRPPATSAAPRDAREPLILVPRWMPGSTQATPGAPPPQQIALFGGARQPALRDALVRQLGDALRFHSPADTPEELAQQLRLALDNGLRIDALWLLDVAHDAVFAMAKLLSDGQTWPGGALAIQALTLNAFAVHDEAVHADAAHGVWGLLQSLSREQAQLRVSLLDLDRAECSAPQVEATLGSCLPAWTALHRPARSLAAWRQGRLYQRQLFTVQPAVRAPESRFRTGGVYLVVGGAGGVGLEFARHLRQRHGARVALVGRRALDEALQTRLQALGDIGTDVLYLQADVQDAHALRAAIAQTQAAFGALHGVVHSAMVLDDQRLVDMDATRFAHVMAPKAQGMRALAEATQDLSLDLLLVFSSMQSYVGNASQANYAAASTFIDGYAASLRSTRAYPVAVVNWGFWSEVGAVATPLYRQLLARQGVAGLETARALAELETMLAEGWDTALILAAEDTVLVEMGWSNELTLARPEVSQPLALPRAAALSEARLHAEAPLFRYAGRAMADLVALARRRVSRVLHELNLHEGGPAAVDQAVADGRVVREHAALLKVLQQQFHSTNDEGLDAQAFLDAVDALTAAQRPALRHFAPLLRASVAAYPDILIGRVPAAEVVFPNGSPELVRAVYGQSEVSRFYNLVVAGAVRSLAEGLGRDRPIRILEIGAGTGSTTVEVLHALNSAGIACDYLFTDLWDKLLADAQQRLGPQHPELRFSFLDIGTDPALQGMKEPFDVVVATNVLHATRNLHLTLRHVKRLLKPGGALVLNESVEVQAFSTLTFGLLPGWWSAADSNERLPQSPLADTAGWTRLLADEGYVHTRPLLSPVADAPSLLAQQVLVAYSNGEVRLPAAAPSKATAPLTAAHCLPPALDGRLRPYALAPLATTGEAAPSPRLLRLYQDDNEHLWVFLDHAPANTFTEALLTELIATLRHLYQQAPERVRNRVVYLSHMGEYFSLGGDRSEIVQRLMNGQHDELASFAQKAAALLHLLATMDSIIVAVVNGTAQGGGMETLFATDLQVVGEHVQLGLPEVKSGLIPGMGGLTYLKGQIGMARTKRMVMLGELMSAHEAQALGLVSHVAADPFAEALSLPQRIGHVGTAVEMKQILARDLAPLHTADIDDWLRHVLHNDAQIDTRRIENASLLLEAKRTSSPADRPSPVQPSTDQKVAA